MRWGTRKEEEEEVDPVLQDLASDYKRKFDRYNKTRALYVCGKASKAAVEAAKQAATNAATFYRRRYFTNVYAAQYNLRNNME